LKPTISIAVTTGLLESIATAGGDPDQILLACGLCRSDLSNREGSILCSVFTRLLDEGARATGDNCFGLHFGERYNPKNIGALSYVVLNSPTIKAGFDNIGRYLRIHNEAGRVSLETVGERVYLRHWLADLGTDKPRQHNEYSMAVALNLIRLMVGSQWTPVEVQFAHQMPGETAEHTRVFGAPIAFDCPTNAFVIDGEFVERQVPAADERLYRILQRYLEKVLEELPPEDDLLAASRKAIAELMREGSPALAQVTKKLSMSQRTLERRLKEHGTAFKKLLDDTRRRFALKYLKDRKNTLTEIAFLLGYSEVSAFNRAFKRWTGSPPLDYRRRKTANKANLF
jgi:AraC-like DNA-binding protein